MLDVLFLLNCVCYMLCFKQTELVADCYALSSFCCLKLKHESVLFECIVFAFLCEAAVKQVVRRYVTMWAYVVFVFIPLTVLPCWLLIRKWNNVAVCTLLLIPAECHISQIRPIQTFVLNDLTLFCVETICSNAEINLYDCVNVLTIKM